MVRLPAPVATQRVAAADVAMGAPTEAPQTQGQAIQAVEGGMGSEEPLGLTWPALQSPGRWRN